MEKNFEFRSIKFEEHEEAARIEAICFPPNEACTPEHIRDRIKTAPDQFLAAVDREKGKIAGFLNGIATNEERFRDEFFVDESLHNPDGKYIMIMGLDVLPEYRMHGLGRELVRVYAEREKKNGREAIVLTCLERLVGMYKKFGFEDLGAANSTWGGEEWHEMILHI